MVNSTYWPELGEVAAFEELVGAHGGEAYDGNIGVFERNTHDIMARLVEQLPDWLARHAQR